MKNRIMKPDKNWLKMGEGKQEGAMLYVCMKIPQ
jgi:hypothetical protein